MTLMSSESPGSSESAESSEDPAAQDPVDPSDMVDELPEDLDRGFVGVYHFPDNKRRRIPGVAYIVLAALVAALAVSSGEDAVLSNNGLIIGCVGLGLIGIYHVFAAIPLRFDENDALVAATTAVDFPVGHASAQLGWRGFRSRPTWRVLVYSADDPPTKRGLVLIDAGKGLVFDQIVEDNPEDWSQFGDDGLASASDR